MNTEKGSAAMHIDLTDGKITVRHTHNDGVILHQGYAPEGTWNALWAIIRGMVETEEGGGEE